ncbi:uncharacterized protein [Arachis hypogaea]|uniref:uncharacterized protein n=1 Tax=Arachis hypogaea TaxID=3818 RepID=UPI000DEC0DFD|nr:uncharacterized protein LOC112721257 [Arachis hypogaea]
MAPVGDLAEPVFADNTLESLEGQVLDHHLSCNAMLGTSGPSTICVKVSINGLEVQALIDGGSSDSFIQPCIAKFLNLPIELAPGIKVIVGDFNILTIEGKIANLDINVAGCTISIPEVYVLHVAGGDLVIGTTWLMTLKAHIVDYNASFLRFVHQGKFVTIWSEKSSMASQIQFHHIQRLVSTHAIAEAFSLELQTPADTSQASLPLPASLDPALVSLLRKYVAIFATPSRLPPQRSQDHSIPLVTGAEPVKARPYRYHHSLKSQIESMSLMNDVFKPYLCKFVLVFFDDILVYSSSFDSHLEHLELVLKLLRQKTLFAKLSKCLFGTNEVDYLGHTITGSGVLMESTKVQAIQDWPQPSSVKQLRAFLGLMGYYRHFIKGYATLVAPLTDLLKKDTFVWSDQAMLAFHQLQQAISTKTVLALPNFNLLFEVETDASGTGIGAVLIQQRHPIAYFSKKLPPTLQKQSAYIREFYAITEAIAKF